MITILLFNLLIMVVGSIFVFLPVVTIADIPLIGQSVSDVLYFIVLKWNAFMVTFPYAQTAWDMFIYIIIPFEMLLLVMKFFFGGRSPVNTN